MAGYGDKKYWDKRYTQKEEKYDWYLSYGEFRDQLTGSLNVLDKDGKDLKEVCAGGKKRLRSDLKLGIVGCGNSDMSLSFYEDGFTNIISFDYSEIVINKMKNLYKDKPSLLYEVQDVRQLTYEDETFDVLVDKGTLDAILCGSDSLTNATGMLEECYRCLKRGGFFFCNYIWSTINTFKLFRQKEI